MSASDNLSTYSRNFLEQSKFKVVASLLIISCALVFLGFCASAGGESAAQQVSYTTPGLTNYSDVDIGKTARIGSLGFSAFCYIVACCLCIYAGFFISPHVCGTNNEKATLRYPREIEKV